MTYASTKIGSSVVAEPLSVKISAQDPSGGSSILENSSQSMQLDQAHLAFMHLAKIINQFLVSSGTCVYDHCQLSELQVNCCLSRNTPSRVHRTGGNVGRHEHMYYTESCAAA